MPDHLPVAIEIAKTIPRHVADATVGGHSYVDDEGQWVVQLDIAEGGNKSYLVSVLQGDTVVFGGATWTVTKVYEPRPTPRGAVATLTRVG